MAAYAASRLMAARVGRLDGHLIHIGGTASIVVHLTVEGVVGLGGVDLQFT
jgi:hypothetical protein